MVVRVCLMVLVVAAAAVVGASVGGAPLAQISGSARKIRMYIKNTYLQLTPDGTVSGVRDDTSKHTIFQRSSVMSGQVKIQGVTTCMYLCMDTCGLPYAAKNFTDECVFNETIQQHNYNTYSSAKYSNARRTLYLGLNKKGLPRRVQIRGGGSLGKLSMYTRVLPLPLSEGEVEETGGARCPPSSGGSTESGRCRRPRRRRRKRKRCREGEEECGQRRRRVHRVRHRKHRTADEFEEELDDEDIDDSAFIDHNESD